jgi:hypothetical protein
VIWAFCPRSPSSALPYPAVSASPVQESVQEPRDGRVCVCVHADGGHHIERVVRTVQPVAVSGLQLMREQAKQYEFVQPVRTRANAFVAD